MAQFTERSNNIRRQSRTGSALILVVVLTVMLSIIGVLFVMASRVDVIATSGISEVRQLDTAVNMVRMEKQKAVAGRATKRAQERLIDLLFPDDKSNNRKRTPENPCTHLHINLINVNMPSNGSRCRSRARPFRGARA